MHLNFVLVHFFFPVKSTSANGRKKIARSPDPVPLLLRLVPALYHEGWLPTVITAIKRTAAAALAAAFAGVLERLHVRKVVTRRADCAGCFIPTSILHVLLRTSKYF